MYGSFVSFAYFDAFFLKIPKVKIRGSIALIYTKNMYDITIAIIYKFFEFQNDWLEIIRIRDNCTQFYPIPLY